MGIPSSTGFPIQAPVQLSAVSSIVSRGVLTQRFPGGGRLWSTEGDPADYASKQLSRQEPNRDPVALVDGLFDLSGRYAWNLGGAALRGP